MVKTYRPFARSELKILVYNKVKRGMSYADAVEQTRKEIETCKINHQENIESDKRTLNEKFKEEFDKLKNEKKE